MPGDDAPPPGTKAARRVVLRVLAAVGGWLVPAGLRGVPAARSAVPELRSGFTYSDTPHPMQENDER